MSKGKVCLVPGGAGFIGSHVAEHLVKAGRRVVILDDLSGGYVSNVPKDAIFVNGTINNVELLENLFDVCGFDYVFHLAAYAAEGLSHFVRRFNYENNLIGSVNLINQSILKRVKHFVFTSSIAVYGSNQLPMTESLIPKPEDPYGIAKLAVENDLETAHKLFGLDYTIFRPHNVYGERQNLADPYRNVMGIFINKCLRGEKMPIFGNGSQTRAFSYIDDVAPYIASCTEIERARNEIFNIGADRPYPVKEIAVAVASHFGVKARIKFLKARREVKHAYSDHTKVKGVFNIDKAVTLEEGLKRMIDWARKTSYNTFPKWPTIEIERNLPEAWKRLKS